MTVQSNLPVVAPDGTQIWTPLPRRGDTTANAITDSDAAYVVLERIWVNDADGPRPVMNTFTDSDANPVPVYVSLGNGTYLPSWDYPALARIWDNDEDAIYDKENIMAIKIAHPGGGIPSNFGGDYDLIMVEKESGAWLADIVKALTSFDGTGRITYPGDGKPPIAGRITIEWDNTGDYPYVGVFAPDMG